MSSKGPRIVDNPSIAKLQRDERGAKQLLKLRPLLRLFGVRFKDSLEEQVRDSDQQVQEFTTLPDRFNDLFVERGWIAYETFNADLMRRAVELGEAGDPDTAEQHLADHFDEGAIERGIKNLVWAVEAFRPRERLARLALVDYLEERFHACIPVQLMIIDGLVNDVSRSKGFFAEGTELTAWDSIAAHDRGLQRLAQLWGRGRKKTTTEPITLPYRHGILHGRDLSYDNRLVAAKLWAALFALREWAVAVRDDRIDEPPPEPEPSLLDSLEQLRRVREQRAQLDAWEPRSKEVLAAIPRSGTPDDFEEGSPERALADLLSVWRQKNYGHMVRLLYMALDEPLSDQKIGQEAGKLRAHLDDKVLQSFEILEIQDQAAAATDGRVRILYEKPGEVIEKELDIRILHLDEQGSPVVRGPGNGSWKIHQAWLWTLI